MNYLDKHLQDRIEEKLRRLNKLRPLPAAAVKKLQEQFRIEMTYNSNGIEGNSLTLKETFLVINEGITVKGKPLKDHLEAKAHYEALEFLSDLVEQGKKQAVSEALIRKLHCLVVKDTDQDWAGKYRMSEVIIGGADHFPPPALDGPDKMRDFISWIKKQQKSLPAIELAALIHHQLVHIHPFFDGNGRSARLVMNLVLMQKGYPLVIVLKNDRKKYYRVLARADKKDFSPLVRFIAQCVERSLDLYLKVLTPATKKQEKYLLLSELSQQTSFSAKYLNLLVRQGKLEAYKQGKNWLTTKESLDRYLANRIRKR